MNCVSAFFHFTMLINMHTTKSSIFILQTNPAKDSCLIKGTAVVFPQFQRKIENVQTPKQYCFHRPLLMGEIN